MKKSFIYICTAVLLMACVSKRPEKRGRFMKGFSAQYNTLFNADQALEEEINSRLAQHKDNFYAPYIAIFPYEKKPVDEQGNNLPPVDENPFGDIFGLGNRTPPSTPPSRNRKSKSERGIRKDAEQTPPPSKKTTMLEIAEAKALKTIDKFSVIREEQEKNKVIFDAYITLIKARIYMGENFKALDAINMMNKRFPKHKRIGLGKVYQGLAYSNMGDYARANKIFEALRKEPLHPEDMALMTIYYGENLLKNHQNKEAIDLLSTAFDLNKNNKIKSRIAFLKGQILLSENQLPMARESFQKAYDLASDFEFEVKSQIEIAKTFNAKNNYAQTLKYLDHLSKKGTYASRKNEFLYAKGLLAHRADKKKEARDFFFASVKEKATDTHIKGLSYYEIGKSFLEEDDYIRAGIYYDSAVVAMTYEPTKKEVQKQSEDIKKVSDNYYLIKRNDSILALTKMSKAEQIAFFNQHIAKLKVKEEEEERKRRIEERQSGFQDGDFGLNSIFGSSGNAFQDFGNPSGKFYFANASTVARGISDFKQLWGDRALADNWRFSKRTSSVEEVRNQALGQTSEANPRRFEPAFYTEQIPNSLKEIDRLKKERDEAELNLGTLFRDAFNDIPLATKTLYGLIEKQPEEKVMLQALFQIFSMNFEHNPQAAEKAKIILLKDYPHTAYAEYARNPRNSNFVKSSVQAEHEYAKAYFMYEQAHFEESRMVVENALMQFKNDALIPKFHLLNAHLAGKLYGKEVMILQLQQIVLNYEKTLEGIRAAEILKNLKSDLDKKTVSPKPEHQQYKETSKNTPPKSPTNTTNFFETQNQLQIQETKEIIPTDAPPKNIPAGQKNNIVLPKKAK